MKNFRNVSFLNMKRNIIFRSEALLKLTKKDIRVLKENVDVVVDLRTTNEVIKTPDIKIDGIEYLNIPLISDENLNSYIIKLKNHDPNVKSLYRFFVSEVSNNSLKEIFNLLFNLNGKRVLFHCSQGKDRTGVMIALILKALGIDDSSIYQDFLKTNDCITIPFKYRIAKLFINKENRKEIVNAYKVNSSYLDEMFDEIVKLYGSFDNYLCKELELSEERIKELKDIYLE